MCSCCCFCCEDTPISGMLMEAFSWFVDTLFSPKCSLFAQIQANNWKLAKALQELRRLLRQRLEESRSIVGFNLSGLSAVSQSSKLGNTSDNELTQSRAIWSGIGLGRSI